MATSVKPAETTPISLEKCTPQYNRNDFPCIISSRKGSTKQICIFHKTAWKINSAEQTVMCWVPSKLIIHLQAVRMRSHYQYREQGNKSCGHIITCGSLNVMKALFTNIWTRQYWEIKQTNRVSIISSNTLRVICIVGSYKYCTCLYNNLNYLR